VEQRWINSSREKTCYRNERMKKYDKEFKKETLKKYFDG